MAVNDACCLPPVSEGVEFWENLPPAFANYSDLIGEGRFPSSVVDDPDAFIDLLDQAGTDKVLLHGEDSKARHDIEIPNEDLATFSSEYPERLYPLSGFDPHRGEKAIEKLERGLNELDMAGVVIQPMMSGIPADDERYEAAFDLCEKHDAIAWVHTSVHHASETPMEITQPTNLDEVLRNHPDLSVIAGHAGFPNILELVGLMMKYENLYTEISAWSPKYLAKGGTGWEPLLVYGNSILKDRILFGSNWPGFGDLGNLINEFEEHVAPELHESTSEKWLHDNLLQLL
jgi:predicted TIM-barrel fold metal-dependent hydrolase